MRKILLLAVAALIVVGIGAWIGVSANDQTPVMMTGAKGLPTSHYDDYDLVVH